MAEILMSEQLVSKTNTKESVDLRGITTTLRKYKWLILLFTLVATLLTSLIVSSATPKYRSTVTLLFEKNKAKTGYENPWGEFGNLEDEIQTQLQVLRSRNFARRVVTELNLQEHWEYNPTLPMPERFNNHGPLAPAKTSLKNFLKSLRNSNGDVVGSSEPLVERMARRFSARSKIYSVKGTSLLKISVDGIDRKKATEVANGAAEIYIQSFLDQTTGRNARAKEFLKEKVDEFKVKLDNSEQMLLDERRKYGIQGDGGDLTKETLTLLNRRLLDAKARLEAARIQWNEVRNVPAGGTGEVVLTEVNGPTPVTGKYVGTGYETLSIVDSNPSVQQRKQRMQEMQRVLDELNNRYGEKHPRVVDATSNLAVAVKNLDRQIGNVLSSVEKNFLAAQGEVNSLQADIRREESRQYGLSEGRAAIKEIELTRNTDRRFYEDALAELRDFQENDLETTPMSITDAAVVPRTPFRPRKSLVTMLGFLLSLVGISVLLCAYEAQKETARGVNAFEKKLGIPVLGIIPTVKGHGRSFQRSTTPLIPGSFDDKRNTFKEAIRTLRTRSTVSELESDGKVIMVTSSVPGEGKSTVATNLAYSLSKLENVVLVEADLRRPGIGRALGIKSDGLSDLLERRVYLEDCIRPHIIGELDLLPAGNPRESDLELLASPEFGELVDLLKSRYDRVVLDLAPVQAVSDAMVVGKYTDSAIYVVKADSTPLPLVERGISLLKEVGVKVSGAVISQVDLAKLGAYGGDYYYLGYFDYYGYADEDGDRQSSKLRAVTDYAERSRNRERAREARKVAEMQAGKSTQLDPVIRTGNMAS
jgi:capsular exopolysaccharide synthesis family protein